MSYKVAVLKNFTKFIGKDVFQSLFLNKIASLRAQTYLKQDCNTGVFLWILQNFKENLQKAASDSSENMT